MNMFMFKKGKLVTSGMGKAGQMAHDIATTFSSTDTFRFFFIRVKLSMVILEFCRKRSAYGNFKFRKNREIEELFLPEK